MISIDRVDDVAQRGLIPVVSQCVYIYKELDAPR